MTQYNIVAENPESTLVSVYEAPEANRAESYQSEAALERAFIDLLKLQAYEYLPIKDEKDLIVNLRRQLEKLNGMTFSDNEWDTFFKKNLANPNQGIEDKTRIIQEDYIQLLTRDDGTTKNVYLLDKEHIHNNTVQVINQYETDAGVRENRYDVTILVNGLPLVHVELKRRGVDIKEAFNQINRYQRESFWSGSGLYEYVQIFVISNGTYTKYYSNTTRFAHIKEQRTGGSAKSKKTSNSFEFTSWWADGANTPIPDLMDFGRTFFAKHTILNILTRYCVFTSDKLLLVMRPYQIAATEAILTKINVATNYKWFGSVKGGGYIWHTTGSGKTLTSFKTAQLATNLPFIDKVLFVVDRKDLDYQTMKEYDKFEKGAANSNTSTKILARQLGDPDARIIITTIQKLSIFISRNKEHPVYNQHLVIIFDECHRSQFGDMHRDIIKAFKRYHIFGFTGTPIFAENASASGKPDMKTTEQAFGERLHVYTIINAIADKNVLPFRTEYISTIKEKEDIRDKDVYDIDREKALLAPQRISNVVKYILEHFNQKTKRNERSFDFNLLTNISEVAQAKKEKKVEEVKRKIRMTGFNSIFAVASIEAAKIYYSEFKRQMKDDPAKSLKVALIYSFGVNEDEEALGGMGEENSEDTSGLDQSSRDFLENAIKDYNAMFGTSYDTSSDKFQNYYKDVSLRMKNREIDLLIVVNMFLTGFDATTLNTLWVDKNLRLHGLLQAYSRTNRILNSVKTFGNIVCFRNLEEATNRSIALFGDKDAAGQVLLRPFKDYYYGYTNEKGKEIPGYKTLVEELLSKFKPGEVLTSEERMKEFIRLFNAILKLTNILSCFDEFAELKLLTERDEQDFRSMYIDAYQHFIIDKPIENVNDDLVFEMELIKQVEITIDYILALIRKYHAGHMQDKEIVVEIMKRIGSDIEMRKKKDLIESFIASLKPESNVDDDWNTFIAGKRKEELDKIIEEENLNPEETRKFMENAFRDGFIQRSGTAITKILPPVSRFTPTGERAKKRASVLEKLTAYFERFWNISDTPSQDYEDDRFNETL